MNDSSEGLFEIKLVFAEAKPTDSIKMLEKIKFFIILKIKRINKNKLKLNCTKKYIITFISNTNLCNFFETKNMF